MSDVIRWSPCTVNRQAWMEPRKDGQYVGIESYDKLRAQLETVTKERDELTVVNELIGERDGELIARLAIAKEQRDTARAQRDRAMVLVEECRPPDKAHEGPCHLDAGCDSSCSNRECRVLDYIDLVKEIAKEKDGR